jgi:hypothetical protein
MDDAAITHRGGQVVTTWVAQTDKWRTYARGRTAASADRRERGRGTTLNKAVI